MRRPSSFICILLLLFSAPAWTEEPQVGRSYFSVKVTSGSEADMLRAMEGVQNYPFARVVRSGNGYALYIGFWHSRSEAVAVLQNLKPRFRSAIVDSTQLDYSTRFNPGAMLYDRPSDNHPPQAVGDNIYRLTPLQSNILAMHEGAGRSVIYSEAPQGGMAQNELPRNIAHAGEPEYASFMLDTGVSPFFLRMTRTLSFYPIMGAPGRQAAASVSGERLAGLAREAMLRQQIEQGIASRDAAGLAALAQQHPEAFSCQNVNWAWSLAEAHATLGQPVETEKLLQRLLECPLEQDRLATIYKAKNWLDADHWEKLLAIEEKTPRSPQGEEKFRQLRYDRRLEKLLAANEDNNRVAVEQYFSALAPDIEARKDAAIALLGAWNYYQRAQYELAASWFRRVLEWDAARHEALQGLARCALQEKRFDEAASYAEAMPATMPDRAELLVTARSGLIEPLVSSGNRATALQHLDKWAADSAADDLRTRLHLGGWFINLEEYARAQKLIDPLLASYPDHPRALDYAWQIAQHAGRLDEEIDYLKRSFAAEQAARNPASPLPAPAQNDARPTPKTAYENIGIDEFGSPKKIQRDWKEKKLAALIDRRSDWFSSAVDARYRSGAAGLSEFHSVEIPLEYKTPWQMNDEIFFRTDLIKLKAGDVDPANNSFGSLLFLNTISGLLLTDPLAACRLLPPCKPALLRQDEQGMSFTAGYQRDDLSADIGFTPRNFPVSNVVGGIRQKGDWGRYGYSLEASRRPVTSSLLSFAGTRDPLSDRTWGGVVATGGRLGLSLDKGEEFGFWSSLGLHRLTGRNVLSNSRLQLMAGGQWRIVNEENRLFSLGLTGMYWHHTQNAGEYTVGHGGYYSPLNYRSLSLPLTYAKRTARFSYMLRGAVSASQSQTRSADYYPTIPWLQALAVASTPINFVTPIYAGGSSHGTGQSLKAAWEYQLEPKLFIGGQLSLDRSVSYAPNRILFYMRYSLDHPVAQPAFMPPEPIEPSSQF